MDHPLMFLSFPKAEAKAHQLGRRMAAAGRTTRVVIRDHDQNARVTALYFAVEDADTPHRGARAVA